MDSFQHHPPMDETVMAEAMVWKIPYQEVEKNNTIDFDRAARFMGAGRLNVELDCNKYDAINHQPASGKTACDEFEADDLRWWMLA